VEETCFKKYGFLAHFKKTTLANSCVIENDPSCDIHEDFNSQESMQRTNTEERNFDFTPEQK
jgi:hypothetical protein